MPNSGTEIFAGLVSRLMESGISEQEAHRTAFFMAALLAEMSGQPELAQYGYERSRNFVGSTASDIPSQIEAQMKLEMMDGETVSANEVNLRQAHYQNSYWH